MTDDLPPILAALGAAASFACAAILQQEESERAPSDESLSFRLLLDLLRRRKWVLGVVFLLIGYGLQSLALAYGPVALVQPIVVTELAIAIPLAMWRRRRRASARDWLAIFLVLGGISTFLVIASPVEGTTEPGAETWLMSIVPVAALVVTLTVIARRLEGRRKASVLGAAAGLAFGVLAVLTKAITHIASTALGSLPTSWQLYSAIVLGILALVVSQSAYQAGPLAYSMPLVGTLEPLTAVLIGDTALHEQVQLGTSSLVPSLLCATCATFGIILLSTSPTVLDAGGSHDTVSRRRAVDPPIAAGASPLGPGGNH